MSKFFLIIGGLVIGIFVSELVVRILELSPKIALLEVSNSGGGEFLSSLNPELKYIPRPNSGLNNSYGLKNKEISIENPTILLE